MGQVCSCCRYWRDTIISFWEYLCCKKTLQKVNFAIKKPDTDVGGVDNDIIHRLGEELCKRNIDLMELSPEQAAASNTPVIVFCVFSSRLGVDIDSALSGVNKESPLVLVILHNARKNIKRADLSSYEDLLEDSYHLILKREERIVHFAFSEYDGDLYDCRENTDGLQKLADYFSHFHVQVPESS